MKANPPPRVSACIVTWNNASTIVECLRSALGQTGVDLDCVVVDNASVDITTTLIREQTDPRIMLIERASNTGFAAGMNLAIAHSQAQAILILNPDVVLADACVERLLESLAIRDAAAVQPRLFLRADDDKGGVVRIDSVGIRLDRNRIDAWDMGHGLVDRGQWNDVGEIFGPTGACALWRRGALLDLAESTGIFDEQFFAYYEDVDLAWRARRRGYRLWYVPSATASHERKNPPFHGDRVDAIAFSNRWLLFAKNASPRELLSIFPRLFFWDIPRLAARTLARRDHGVAWRRLVFDVPLAIMRRMIHKRV